MAYERPAFVRVCGYGGVAGPSGNCLRSDGAKRPGRCRQGRDGRGPARRDRRSGKPCTHRARALGHHRLLRSLSHRRPAAGRLHHHVHAARLQHRPRRELRPARRLRRDGERRHESRRTERDDHRFGRSAAGGRAEHEPKRRLQQGSAREPAEQPADSEPCADHSRRGRRPEHRRPRVAEPLGARQPHRRNQQRHRRHVRSPRVRPAARRSPST